ncbi:hypothetical protein ACP70R_026523 [Stipagrostis hirtigluma subsp. patula]
MHAMAGANPAPAQTAGHVNNMARPIPSGLVPVAVLLAAAVGLLSLLPSLAQAVWEVPHLFLLGLVISYGVFAHNTADADKAAGAGDAKDGAVAWSSRYHPDEPLVVVADHAASDADDGEHGARERPISLPVRRLKPAAAQVSEAGNDSDGVGEETDSSASSAGFWAGACAAPSPPSVLDADVSHSPCSQQEPPSPPPFSVHSNMSSRSNSATTLFTKSRGFPGGYHPTVPRDQPSSDDGEVTDWDEEDGESDQMTVSAERSFPADFTACANHGNDQSDGDTSVDEELLKLARKAAPEEGSDEVDRKADEFIAKFREQIRLQRH